MNKKDHFYSPMAKYILSIIIISVIILICNYLIVQKSYNSNFTTLSQAQNLQLKTEFNSFYNTNDAVLSILSETPGLENIINSFSYINIHNAISSNINFSYIVNLLDTAKSYNQNIQSISLMIFDRDAIIFDSGNVYDLNTEEIISSSNQALETLDSYFVYPYHYDFDYNNVVIGLRKIIYYDGKPIGAFTLNFNHEIFNNLIFPSESPNHLILMFDSLGQILYASDDNTMNWQTVRDLDSQFQQSISQAISDDLTLSFTENVNDKSYTFFSEFLGDKNLFFFIGHYDTPLKRKILLDSLLLSTISLILFVIYASYCSVKQNKVNQAIRHISDSLHNAGMGHFRFSHIKSEQLTVTQLNDHYNEMLSNLETISDNIASISFNVHQYATALNEDSTINSKAIEQIANAILTISQDTMEQVDEIETLGTLAKSIDIKIDHISSNFKALEQIVILNHHLDETDSISETNNLANFAEFDSYLNAIKEDIIYLKNRKDDISNHLKELTNTSRKNAMVNRKIKQSIDQQRDALKNMSKTITNLYRTSLNLNNNLSKFIVKVTPDEKHPS